MPKWSFWNLADSLDHGVLNSFARGSIVSYYGTKTHEFIHWTAHERRLNRGFWEQFGNEKYASEELVAEIGAASLCADQAITLEPGADPAAVHAQKAADFLHDL